MSPENAGQLVLVLLGTATVSAAWGWSKVGVKVWAPASVILLASAALSVTIPERITVDDGLGIAVLVVLAGALAILGGGPVTSRVFAFVDGHAPALGGKGSIDRAADVLRGGAMIGALERAAIFATLVAGWPEGLAIVLGLKGLGRYPELRNQEATGAAERFIIGTFSSVLWAAACAGVVLLLL